MIILGLDEAAGFAPVGLTKPREMTSAIAAKARSAFDPPITIHLDQAFVDGEAWALGETALLRLHALESNGLPKPLFYDDALRFTVVLRQRSNNGRSGTSGRNLSRHSWAIAIDVNPTTNAYGNAPTLDRFIVEIFRSNGFAWAERSWCPTECTSNTSGPRRPNRLPPCAEVPRT